MTERLHFHFSFSCIGEGNGNPLQCYCLENPRDGGAWWAAVCGVTQSRIQLKQLSSSSSSSSSSMPSLKETFNSSLSVALRLLKTKSTVSSCIIMPIEFPGLWMSSAKVRSLIKNDRDPENWHWNIQMILVHLGP